MTPKTIHWLVLAGVLVAGVVIGSLGYWGISSWRESRERDQYLYWELSQGAKDNPYALERLREDIQDERAKTVLLANVSNENVALLREMFPWDYRAQSMVTFDRDWRLSRTPNRLALDQRQANWLASWTRPYYGYRYYWGY